MAGLKEIKGKIAAMKKSQTVTKAMEAVSAAKMRKAQLQALRGRSYARAASQVLSRISGSRELASHPLAEVREVKRALYIVITSDKGLAGALNSGVLRAVARDIREQGSEAEVIALGKKAYDFFSSRGFATSAQSGASVEEVVRAAQNRFEAGAADVVKIAYQNFVSTFEQRPTIRTVLPLSLESLQEMVADIVPQKGAFADAGSPASAPSTYTLEPSGEEVLSVILPRLAAVVVYHATLEAQASEHSARMVAMKSASDKAGEMQEALTLQFNKARQAAITREVSEITGGMEAMAK